MVQRSRKIYGLYRRRKSKLLKLYNYLGPIVMFSHGEDRELLQIQPDIDMKGSKVYFALKVGAPWGVTKWTNQNLANKVTKETSTSSYYHNKVSLDSPRKRPLGPEAHCHQTQNCLWSVLGLSISPERSHSEWHWSLYHSRWECLWYQSLKVS